MRFLVPILAIVLATYHTFQPHVADARQTVEYNAYKSGQLRGFLEKFKETMKKGDEQHGVPVLDPFMNKHEHIDLNEKGLFSAKGDLDNLRIAGLSDYQVNQGDFTIAGLKANVALLFRQINIMTRYNVSGTLIDEISYYGRGNLALVIRQLNVTADLKLGVKNERMQVSNLVIHAHVKEFDCVITGLYDDENLSRVISRSITKMVPDLLEKYQNRISQYVSKVATNVMNNILKQYTLKDLLDMIGH
ncbi:uncharacterized protein [Bombus flavifrons]|uniref:uncharacterized protein n=1 Tax=Bombus flavifrons TaxID=103934 RepID=UPI003704B0BD